MLSTAEMLVGISRHLGAYGSSQPKADFGQLEFAGHTLEIALRLRGSGVASVKRAEAMASDAGIRKGALHKEILPALEALRMVDLERTPTGDIINVSESVPPVRELFSRAGAILDIVMPEPLERMALTIIQLTTVMPTSLDSAVEACASIGNEATARIAIDHLISLHLCYSQRSADGHLVLFNPNVWAIDKDYASSALAAEDGDVRAKLSGLIEEVTRTAGLPEEDVVSCEPRWINFAVSQGLILRSLVTTAEGIQRVPVYSTYGSLRV